MLHPNLSGESSAFTPAHESHYVQQWHPLVKRIVRQLAPQADSLLCPEDMEQIALIGLLESLRRYGEPDERFAGYASQRIRGAVLDQFRLHDWRPRRMRQKTHKTNDAIREMSRVLGREPTQEEVCQQLRISVEDYQEYLMLNNASAFESLDLLLSGEVHCSAFEGRRLDEEIEIQLTLARAIDSLDEREKVILSLYYKQNLGLKEIAMILDLTLARVCQLNKQIGAKIKAFF